jgi:photosystem II stability/assembly factor-like uncharacterized protein
VSGNDLETRLRATLAEHATQAPPGAALAERILAEVEAPARVLRPRHGWRTWTTPLLAAGAVAAVVAAVVGIQSDRHTASPPPGPAVSQSGVPAPAVSSPTPTPSPSTAVPTSTPTATLVPGAPTTHPRIPTNAIGLAHFEAIDTTFIGTNDGWALGSADCLDGSGQPCASMVHTTDGGQTWHSMPNPPGNVPLLTCEAPCFTNIRFATDQIGYAYSSKSLYMTTDGGQTWADQHGSADALETLDQNVIRVSLEQVSGDGLDKAAIYTAPVGGSTWAEASIPAEYYSSGVQLVREGHTAVVLDNHLIAHAGAIPQADLLVSANDGRSWTARTVPCPDRLGLTQIAAGTDGSLSALCAGQSTQLVVATAPSVTGAFAVSEALPIQNDPTGQLSDIGALNASTLFVSGSDGLYRTTDGGKDWQRVVAVAGDNANYRGGPGFEDAHTGRWLTANGRKIWTTHDGGASWHEFDFS